MRRKELIIVNTLIISMVLVFALLTVKLSVNESLGSLVSGIFSGKDKNLQMRAKADSAKKCSQKSSLQLAKYASDENVSKLRDYQDVCSSYVTDSLMVFTTFSGDKPSADSDAAKMAAKLKLLHAAGVKPIVVAEPYAGDVSISFKDFAAGKYDASISYYFERLKALGVTDEEMGTWVPFPEPNTPNWNNKDAEPRDFALCVNRYLHAMKAVFPTAKASVLLNATTYEPTDYAWDNGDYLDLTPYVQEIDKSLVTSVGIQGFPWVSNASQSRREIFRASEFLQPDLAIAAARELHTRDIWFNTGSFAAKYTNDKTKRVAISPNERKGILNDILDVAMTTRNYQQNAYRVSVNLFSEDKSNATEATDWSYLQDTDNKMVFKDFITRAQQNSVPISLFDTKQ
jgi:hypothetical protein